ncbi:MAG: hypothetical protein ATN34_00850 [Epulopiscium sp. Nele67-Bin002]|nr:MAG: hypothetical protein ATN34_00850 [Epulopiscium sp. Nele67-Bin002]OON92958.1 MAG: hypothetical protein ATN33_06295 [Epulopiscium sp. Nele67-Bin001]
MKILKKYKSLVIAAVMLAATVPVELTTPTYASEATQLDANLEDMIFNALMAGDTTIDLSNFNINIDDIDEFAKQYRTLLFDELQLFHVIGDISYSYNSRTGKLVTLTPYYDEVLQENYDHYYNLLNNEVNKIVELTHEGATNLDKMLILNDYLATNYEYDTTLEISDSARLVSTGKGICQAYTNLAKLVLNELGIANVSVESYDINHTWNMVEYEGEWYNIDFTWADPTPNMIGHSDHSNFMISNERKMEQNEDTYKNLIDDWTDTVPKATNTQFEDRFTLTSSPFVFSGGQAYYMDTTAGSINTINTATGETTVINEVLSEVVWPAGEGYYWLNNFTGFDGSGDYLYYNTPTQIMAYSISDDTSEVLAELELADDEMLLNFSIKNNELTYVTGTDPTKKSDFTSATMEIDLF